MNNSRYYFIQIKTSACIQYEIKIHMFLILNDLAGGHFQNKLRE